MANGHGGKRPGSGRRTKAEILGLAAMIDEAWPVDDQKSVLAKLAADCVDSDFHIRHEARKLLLAYKFGKPKESMDVTSNGETLLAKLVIQGVPGNDGAS